MEIDTSQFYCDGVLKMSYEKHSQIKEIEAKINEIEAKMAATLEVLNKMNRIIDSVLDRGNNEIQ